MASTMTPSEILLQNMRLCNNGAIRGWDRDTKRLWPTLTRSIEEEVVVPLVYTVTPL